MAFSSRDGGVPRAPSLAARSVTVQLPPRPGLVRQPLVDRQPPSPPLFALVEGLPMQSFEHMIEHMTRTTAPRRTPARPRVVGGSPPEFAPPVALSAGPLGVVQSADREIARLTAVRARAVAEFAASRPASADRQQGERGAMSPERWAARPEVLRPVSEWAAQELTVGLSITETAAEALLARSLTLVHRLPTTLAALEAGALHPGHLWPMLEKVAPIEDDRIRAEVEGALLRWAAGRVTTPAQLGDKARREVLKRNARSAARRLNDAMKKRGVYLRPEPTDGMAAVTAVLTMPGALALHRALGAYADELPDDGRSRDQKMADCLLDLVLRPGESDSPPVQVLLTVVMSVASALGGDGAAEIDGHPVPAELARSLLRALRPEAASGVAPPPAAEPAPAAEVPWQQAAGRPGALVGRG